MEGWQVTESMVTLKSDHYLIKKSATNNETMKRRRVCIYCCIQTCFVVYCHFDEFQMIIFFNSEEFTSNHNRRVDRSEEHVEICYKRTDLDCSWWLAVACVAPIQNKRLGTFKYILEVEDFLARRWGFISSINLPIMWWGFKMSSWYHHCDHHVCQSLKLSPSPHLNGLWYQQV